MNSAEAQLAAMTVSMNIPADENRIKRSLRAHDAPVNDGVDDEERAVRRPPVPESVKIAQKIANRPVLTASKTKTKLALAVLHSDKVPIPTKIKIAQLLANSMKTKPKI